MPAAPAPSCAFIHEGTLAVRYLGGVPATDVAIDGHQVTMLVDTGAEFSIVSRPAARALHLPRDQHETVQLNGIGGAMTVSHPVEARTLGFGAITLHHRALAVVPGNQGVFAKFPWHEVGGILGLDVLARYDLDLDLPHRRIRLLAPRNCPAGGPPWPGPAAAPPPVRSAQLLRNLVFEVRLDGHPVPAIIDSGAGAVVVSLAAARRVGVTAAVLRSARTIYVQGGNKSDVAARFHRFRQLAIGGLVFNRPMLPVMAFGGTAPGIAPGVLVGETLLRHHRVFISYAARRVFIAPAPSR